MHETDSNRVVFHSKEDMAGGYFLQKGEHILRSVTKSDYSDINDILELYNIKKYIDNELYLKNWTQDEIESFKHKAKDYGKVVGQFISTIDETNAFKYHQDTLQEYIHSFWELINNHNGFKRISKIIFSDILTNDPHLIHEILRHKKIVVHYDKEIKNFLKGDPQSAEILLSFYEVKDDFKKNQIFLPQSLSVQDKEYIVLRYLDSSNTNLNYVGLIESIRNRIDFKISDKTRLKAKRLHKSETEKFFSEKGGMKYGVSISFPENPTKIKDGFVDEEMIAHYSYSFGFIKENNNPYILFQNFKYLFEYIDNQNRISLVSKSSQLGLFERIMGVQSKNEYRVGASFSLSEMTSQSQIFGYNQVLNKLGISLIDILHFVFTIAFQKKYSFATNARFSIPTASSYFEKVRLLAPEFESALKQFKLFVEDGSIDFELLQISSNPSSIKKIPSLNKNKYLYFNENHEDAVGCSNLFFSDQTLLAYVEPFKEEKYRTFFDLLANEKVKFNNYEEHQKPRLNFLREKGYISTDNDDFINIPNPERVLILKDLYDNDVGSFYHYSSEFQKEALRMAEENIIDFESSLFSKPEQSYFNYFLNKSEFTNGFDLRNSYLHGTQANPDEAKKHEYAFFTYLKLIFLAFLKIDDDLNIYSITRNEK